MQALTGLMSSIAPGMGTLGKVATLGSAGAGTVGAIIQSIQQQQQLNRIKAAENMSPQALGKRVADATQPLSKGLQQNVGNIVQADLASRGLAQAPGIFQGELAQQLAPFYQQNQGTAQNLISQQLGIPMQAYSALQANKPPDLSALFQKLILGSQAGATPGITPTRNPGYSFPGGGTTGVDDTLGGDMGGGVFS